MKAEELGAAALTRRGLVEAGAAVGLTVGATGLLTACGDDDQAGGTSGGKPTRGGNLIVGLGGGGEFETVDAHKGANNIDTSRQYSLYDTLFQRDRDLRVVPGLATEAAGNSDNTQISLTLREGVTFHDGKPFTSADVVYTFKRILDPEGAFNGYLFLDRFVKDVSADGKYGVKLQLNTPLNATAFKDLISLQQFSIVPVDYVPEKPIGTGPFKYQSFTPGQQSVFTRNDEYWNGAPFVDTLTINSIPDEKARVNALISGAVHAIDGVPAALVPTIKGNGDLTMLASDTGNVAFPCMLIDAEPFTDVRVRQAFRLLADRPAIVEQAFGGFARVGNDVPGIDDPLFAKFPQREQDIEQAKSLLKAAGKEGLSVDLVTAPMQFGAVETCVVLAEQAKAAGVNINVKKVPTSVLFNEQYNKRPFAIDALAALYSLYICFVEIFGPNATFNDTHWRSPEFTKNYNALLAESDEGRQKEIAAAMQKELYEEGGQIVPAYAQTLDGCSKKVTGFAPHKSGLGLNGFQFRLAGFTG